MKRLTKVSIAVAISGIVLLLKGNPPLVTAQSQGNPQGQKEETNQPETRRRTPRPTVGRRFVRIPPQKA